MVAPDNRGFELTPSGQRFVPWGFNYDHDERGRLVEEYWSDEWPKVVEDFGEMAALTHRDQLVRRTRPSSSA